MLFFQEEQQGAENDDADDMPEVQETVSVIPGSTLLWRIDSRPAHSATVRIFILFCVITLLLEISINFLILIMVISTY